VGEVMGLPYGSEEKEAEVSSLTRRTRSTILSMRSKVEREVMENTMRKPSPSLSSQWDLDSEKGDKCSEKNKEQRRPLGQLGGKAHRIH
jgi:hypothetical protein